jgi:hypothetical protein
MTRKTKVKKKGRGGEKCNEKRKQTEKGGKGNKKLKHKKKHRVNKKKEKTLT